MYRCVYARVCIMCVYMCVFGVEGGREKERRSKESTMKFGNYLKSATVPEWAPKYLDYHVCVCVCVCVCLCACLSVCMCVLCTGYRHPRTHTPTHARSMGGT